MITAQEARQKAIDAKLVTFQGAVLSAIEKGQCQTKGVYVPYIIKGRIIDNLLDLDYTVLEGHESAAGLLLHLEW